MQMKTAKAKISITLNNDLIEKLKQGAKKDNRSLSQYINITLEKAIEEYEKGNFSFFDRGS